VILVKIFAWLWSRRLSENEMVFVSSSLRSIILLIVMVMCLVVSTACWLVLFCIGRSMVFYMFLCILR